MANEITLNARLQLSNGVLVTDFNPGRIQITQTTQLAFDSVRTITTAEVDVTLTGLTTPHVVMLYNLDATNYVEAGFVTTVYGLRLYPSSIPSIFEINTSYTHIFLKANTASCKVRIMAMEL